MNMDDPLFIKPADSRCHSISFVAATPVNPKFYADTGHWYLSKGIVGINNVTLIQRTLLNELHPEG